MLELDKGNPKLPRHFKPSLKDDEFETPNELFTSLCERFNIYPHLDVAATKENKKCSYYFTINDNALEQEWLVDAWCNHPHTLHKEFVAKCYQQWKKHNINIMMIIPANCMRTSYWHEYIENIAEYRAIKGSIVFLRNGKRSDFGSRNAYVCVIWRKQNFNQMEKKD